MNSDGTPSSAATSLTDIKALQELALKLGLPMNQKQEEKITPSAENQNALQNFLTTAKNQPLNTLSTQTQVQMLLEQNRLLQQALTQQTAVNAARQGDNKFSIDFILSAAAKQQQLQSLESQTGSNGQSDPTSASSSSPNSDNALGKFLSN